MERARDHLEGFLDALAAQGIPVIIPRRVDFLRALALSPPRSIDRLYWVARVTLLSGAEQIEPFDRLFDAWFRTGLVEGVVETAPEPDANERDAEHAAGAGTDTRVSSELGEGTGREASRDELLHRRRLARATEDEQQIWRRTLDIARAVIPRRPGRRFVRHRRRGVIDLRRVLTSAMRTGGDAVALHYRRPPRRMRPVLILIDVSGSMKQHSADFLRFAHGLVQGGERVEAFTFGTRLTRVTRALRQPDVDDALAELAAIVFDFDGGTRIGEAFETLLANSRFRALARGAVVVVLSDGLERGDPAPMAHATDRLARLGHRLLWLSPLVADPAYQPQTRGMRAILGCLDHLGNSASPAALLAELERFSDLDRRPRRMAAAAWHERRRSA